MDRLQDQPSAAGSTLAGGYFEDLEIPPGFEASLKRHREHLLSLTRSLRSAGLTEEQIESSVSTMLASYKQELLRAIKVMRG